VDFGDVEQTLSEKKGPLPVWGYGALVGVAFIYFMHKQSTAAANAAAASDASSIGVVDPSALTTDGSSVYSTDQTAGTLSGYLASDPTNTAQNVGIAASGLPGPVTNAQWARVVADYLNGLGDVPSLVATALSKYLAGQPLSPAETSVVNQALTYGGTPPEGVIPVNGSTASPEPTPTPSTGVTGGFTGSNHASPSAGWGNPTGAHAPTGTSWGSPNR
jgi:hypothetical protein